MHPVNVIGVSVGLEKSRDKTPAQVAMDRLGDALNDAESALKVLESRLQYARVPYPPAPTGKAENAPSPEPAVSSLVAEINNKTKRVDRIRIGIEALMDNLDL